MHDESGESMEPMAEVPLVGLDKSELESVLTERSRGLIPETKRSVLEGTLCYSQR